MSIPEDAAPRTTTRSFLYASADRYILLCWTEPLNSSIPLISGTYGTE
jgi:hypothetical protein